MAKAKPSEEIRAPRGRNPLADLLSVPQVAAAHGVPHATVYRAIQEGRLAAWRHENTYMVPASESRQWQARRRTRRTKGVLPCLTTAP